MISIRSAVQNVERVRDYN